MSISINGDGIISGVSTLTNPSEITVGTGASVFSPSANTLALGTNGSERVRIDSSGNFGLGTASPTAPLTIVATTGQPILNASASTGTNACYSQFSNTAGALIVGRDNSSGGILGGGAYASHIYSQGAYSLVFSTDSTQRAQIDSSGRLLVGATSARTNISGGTQGVLIEGTSSTNSQNRFTEHIYGSDDTAGPYLGLGKTRSTSIGGNTVVQNGDELGGIYFHGVDGSDFKQGAYILAAVDGAPGSNDMPGRLLFATTGDGNFSPTERMRIASDGTLLNFSAGNGIVSGNSAAAGTSTELFLGIHSRTSTTAGGTTSFRVWTNGDVQNTNNSYTGISDIKLKENIIDASSQWSDLKAIQVRNYNFKEETGHETHTQLGVVAQEVELVSPGLVSESPDHDEEGNDLGTVTKSVNYSVLYMKAVKALQEAMERIETLETANASQAATIAALDARLTALEGN